MKRQGNWNPWSKGKAMPLKERLQGKYEVNDITGCWVWLASEGSTGYGQISHNLGVGRQKLLKAHQATWLVFRGSVPKGKVLDHVCRNTRCVNPGHLEPVTAGQNAQRQFLGKVGWTQCPV